MPNKSLPGLQSFHGIYALSVANPGVQDGMGGFCFAEAINRRVWRYTRTEQNNGMVFIRGSLLN